LTTRCTHQTPSCPIRSLSELSIISREGHFYTKVLSKFATIAGLKLTLRVEVAPAEGISSQKVDETKVALRELGLKDSLEGE
jgi:hypothetical protein